MYNNDKLIKDQEQFDKFINILPELKDDEVYFVSLSARNKYLSLEERKLYSLGQTEMFGREIAQNKDKLSNYIIKKLEATLKYKKTRNGLPIPDKSLVCYMNVNPSSMLRAYFQFQHEMNRQISEAVMAMKRNKQPNYSFINVQNRELMNCIQKSPSRKVFLDIDCDTKDKRVADFIFQELSSVVKFYIIETRGGYHYLVSIDSIPEKFNIMKIINDAIVLNKVHNNDDSEIMINGNAMVPVPGTMQSDFLVKIVE